MRQFFFDLVGEQAAHDVHGHPCDSRQEAQDYADFIAHRIGAERPSLARRDNFIVVRDDTGAAIYEAAIRSNCSADLP